MAWYKVVSGVPVSVNYQNGHVASFGRGKVFEADPGLPDVRRLLQTSPKKITGVAKPQEGGFPAPTQSITEPPREDPNKNKKKEKLPPNVHQVVRLR